VKIRKQKLKEVFTMEFGILASYMLGLKVVADIVKKELK
jgi:hypothetical protein